ncbi:hypothetical protein M9434_004381 [Picochlorum sp. BPE23]|nr:hypothetical protein M9434_004381 [Picochlorum sp. BPE23]
MYSTSLPLPRGSALGVRKAQNRNLVHVNLKQVMKTRSRASFFDGFFGDKQGDKFDKGNFVPLEADSDTNVGLDGSTEKTFGPLAILAAGLFEAEFAALQMLLNEMGADEVKLLPYTSTMATKTLGEALESMQDDFEDPFEGSKPVAFLSGMYSSEIVEVVTALRYCEDLPDMAFAAAVPNNYGRIVQELIDDVHADHAAVAAMRAEMRTNDDETE